MKTSYLYQLVNLLSSVLMIVLILVYLDTNQYLQWILFTSIMGAFIQLEGSLNVVSVRLISNANESDSHDGFEDSLSFVAKTYHRASLVGIALIYTLGGIFLSNANSLNLGENWLSEWSIFCVAYLLYYFVNHRSCQLVALNHIRSFSTIALASRIVNISLSLILVACGYAILGLCLSILMSFGMAAFSYRLLAISKTKERMARIGNLPVQYSYTRKTIQNIAMHAIFILFFYSLYRIGLFLDASLTGDNQKQASFGLALQIFFLLLTISSVPLTMRVAPLISAMNGGIMEVIIKELSILTVAVNLVFAIMATGLICIGPVLLSFIPNIATELPNRFILLLLSIAYLIEINIMIIVNAMLARRQYSFVARYVFGFILSIIMALLAWQIGMNIYFSFIVMPICCQLIVTLPLIYRTFTASNMFDLREFLMAVVARLNAVIRRPITVGLSFN